MGVNDGSGETRELLHRRADIDIAAKTRLVIAGARTGRGTSS